jgi:hypothetical protein
MLPQGALVARDGAVVLPEGASVALGDVDGVEQAFENVTSLTARPWVPLYWSRATSTLRLGDSPIRVIHLRDASLGGETQIVLARRTLRADIDLTPKRARWPQDAIDVRVVVGDPSGRIDPSSETIKLEATLNIDALPVNWQRNGNTWTTHIPARSPRGPSVVRVVARDGGSREIGRGFLEIDVGGGQVTH